MRWAMIALPGAVAVVASTLAARACLVMFPPVGPDPAVEAFALWSVPLGVIVAWLARFIRSAWGEFALLWRALGSAVAGAALAVAYAFGSYFVSGGRVMGFEFPVLYCWAAGAIVGLVTGCLIRSDV